MFRKLALLTVIIGGIIPTGVYALGLGDVNLKSYLNQPLNAYIGIVSVDESEMAGMTAKLATPEEFRKAGIDYHVNLKNLKFKVVKRTDGRSYIRVYSSSPFREPYLNILVEVKWRAGRLLKEYALLIDPPVVLPTKGSSRLAVREAPPEKVEPMMTEDPAKSKGGGGELEFEASRNEAPKFKEKAKVAGEEDFKRGDRPDPKIAKSKDDADFKRGDRDAEKKEAKKDDPPFLAEKKAPAKAPFSSEAERFPRIELKGDTSSSADVELADTAGAKKRAITGNKYKVQRGDTMMKIVQNMRIGGSLTLHQKMMAIRQANPHAFIRGNVHLVKANSTLVIPEMQKLSSLSHKEAMSMYRSDTTAFRDGQGGDRAGDKQPEKVAMVDKATKARAGGTSKKKEAEYDFRLAPAETAGNTSKTQLGSDKSDGKKDGSVPTNVQESDLDKAKAAAGVSNPNDIRVVNDTRKFNKLKKKDGLISFENANMTKLQEQARARAAAAKAKAEKEAACKKDPTCNKFKVAGYQKPKVNQADDPAFRTGNNSNFVDTAKRKVDEWIAYLKHNPVMAAGAGGVVLAFFVFLFLIIRQRRRSRAEFQESILEFEDDATRQMPESNFTNSQVSQPQSVAQTSQMQSTGAASSMAQSTPQNEESSYLSDFVVSNMDNIHTEAGESDPITEADVFFAYGKYEAAEMLIKEAIQKEPNRLDLRYKLLDIYHGAKNRESFEYEASVLYDMIDGQSDPMWNKVMDMGRELSPDNSMFSDGADDMAATQMSDIADMQDDILAASSQDAAATVAGSEAPAEAEEFDFDFDFDEQPTQPATGGSENVVSFNPAEASDDILSSAENNLDPYESDDTFMTDVDEVGTKLDLAKAYIDMGDPEGARSILDEVLEEGNEAQKGEAQELMQQMAS